MADEMDGPDRRRFLSGATLGAAGFIVAANASASTPAQGHSHDDEHQVVPSDVALRVKALESLLIEKGMVQAAALDEIVQNYEHNIGPRNGARVVAKAWTYSGVQAAPAD